MNTGSRRSFINSENAKELTNLIPNANIYPYEESTKYRCFNNNNIFIKWSTAHGHKIRIMVRKTVQNTDRGQQNKQYHES